MFVNITRLSMLIHQLYDMCDSPPNINYSHVILPIIMSVALWCSVL